MGSIEQALAEIAAGRPVVVVDGEDREDEGDLIVAAEHIDAATMAFVVRHTSGFVCVALPEHDCQRLALPPLHPTNSDSFGTAYRVTVDAAEGVTTGISARDRAHTARVLASQTASANDLVRPGHVVPLAARPGGVLERAGHTEAAVDLTRLAGLAPAGVLCEIVSTRAPGHMARRPELVDFAAEHGLTMITIAELAAHRRRIETRVERVTATRLPTMAGTVRAVGYRGLPDGAEHIAMVAGEVASDDVPVHIHVECLIGDVFRSLRCGCARRLDVAMREVSATGRGVVLYLRSGADPHHALREQGACVGRLEAPCGPLEPAIVAAVLDDLGVRSVRHLHNAAAVRTAVDELLDITAITDPSGAASDEVA